MSTSLPRPDQSIKIVKVFLASPGDLQKERSEAYAAIQEVNRTVARPAGYHVDLVAWEETLSEKNRPQAVINEQLRMCHVFIGMIWKKWGSRPDREGEGKYTSGFEEEFELACELHEKNNAPLINLYFKNIDEGLLSDPGDDLKKVIKFRNVIVDSKSLLFETFADEHEFAQKVRLAVSEYINRLRDVDSEEAQQRKDQPKDDRHSRSAIVEQSSPSTSTSPEAIFLRRLSEQLTASDQPKMSAVDVSRLRNLAASYRHDHNDETYLQAHDANIILDNSEKLDLGGREVSLLADAGLINIQSENVPLWTWLNRQMIGDKAWLTVSTWISSGYIGEGAIKAMRILGEPIVDLGGDRSNTLTIWFSDDRSVQERRAALAYLGDFGKAEDKAFLTQEIEKEDIGTTDDAVGSMTMFLLRTEGRRSAAEFIVSKSFGVLPRSLIAEIERGIRELDDEQIRSGVNHRSGKVKFACLEVALERKLLSRDSIIEKLDDTDAKVRVAALREYESQFGPYNDKDPRSVLVVKNTSNAFFGLTPNFDHDGESALQSYQMQSALGNPLDELRDKSDDITMDEVSYFAFRRRRTRETIDKLRIDFDDRFDKLFEKDVAKNEKKFESVRTSAALFETIRKSKNWKTRTWMRYAADILEENADSQDLTRLRVALDDDAFDPRPSDIEYLSKFGGGEDVTRIGKIHDDYRVSSPRATLLSISNEKPTRLAAEAVLGLTRSNFDFVIEKTEGSLLSAVISTMTLARFKELSRDHILKLTNNKDDVVRRVTCLKMLLCWKFKDLTEFFAIYKQGEYRFYNVIFWLDLINAFNLTRVRSIARRTLDLQRSSWA